ncbi:MAG: diaminopimelate epimerase [Bacteroidota bacterium]
MQLTFYKYQGTGNDFVMIDDRDLTFPVEDTALVERLCNRRFGIGADGLILLQPHDATAYYMKYYNSDGRESSMCGNGGRCLAAFALHQHVVDAAHTFMAVDGLHDVTYEGDQRKGLWVKLKMKDVDLVEQRQDHAYVLNTGSPHFVQFTNDALTDYGVVQEAKKIRYNNEFTEQGINVNFINLLGLHHIAIRTYERGVEDETLSCGTGVTAAAISTVLMNKLPEGTHTIDVNSAGGRLKVALTYDASTQGFSNIWLQGPATFVFKGSVEI